MTIATAELVVDGTRGCIVDLRALAGAALPRLPFTLRLLLENVARCMTGAERDASIAALLAWLERGTSDAEIAFRPGRVLMHDTTSTPALVDIAAMRDALAEAGADPGRLDPTLPVDVSVDHSLAVEVHARPDAAAVNLVHEMRRNRERYAFLKWAQGALGNVRIHPPGTGIMHTIHIEQLATVVAEEERAGKRWFVPDTMVGTDSHTPMVNGIGVLGWGVGGLEAQTVMFGMPTMLRIPDVIGVRLVGALAPGVLATDLALTVTHRLRAIGVAGEFVEFFGPGAARLDAGARAVVANMAPEYGATTGYFAIDERTLDYLRATGRPESLLRRVEAVAKRLGVWFDPDASPRYTRTLTLDLSSVAMHVAGPQRPQDLLPLGGTAEALSRVGFSPATRDAVLPRHPIAIAAITSCTNTSDPRLLIAAGLVARNARARGMRVPPWVKTSLAPGSPAAADYLRRAGLLDDLAAVGFDIVGYGCTTCIGNPGPLPETIAVAQRAKTIRAVAAISGNRNFPGRIHPELDLAFLMSPPLVVAFAFAGDAERDLANDPVGSDATGGAVFLRDLLPRADQIDAHLRTAADPADFARAFAEASRNPAWGALAAPTTPRFAWQPASTILRRPPYASLDREHGSQLGRFVAHPLLVLGDDVTTDHISPASAIPNESLVADFLVERGDDRSDLNVFASRRGNWEVMLRAAFHSRSLVNLLRPGVPVAHTVHAPSGDVLPLWQAAERYRAAGDAVVVVAGERYGTGSSRDWAAKGQRLLGIRAVLAASFERIHRSNLIGMGIVPLRLPPGVHPKTLAIAPGDRIEIDLSSDRLVARGEVPVQLLRRDGTSERWTATAAVDTAHEIELLRAGGVLPAILQRELAQEPTT
jgi:aconitate hydratase